MTTEQLENKTKGLCLGIRLLLLFSVTMLSQKLQELPGKEADQKSIRNFAGKIKAAFKITYFKSQNWASYGSWVGRPPRLFPVCGFGF